MNKDEDLYFQKDRNQKAHPNITSRDLVCNFDRKGFHYRWKKNFGYENFVMKFVKLQRPNYDQGKTW